MSISNFCREVCPLRAVVLTAIAGGLSGKFCKIPPLQGAVYAVVSNVAYKIAYKINYTVCNKLKNKNYGPSDKNFHSFIRYPLEMAHVYLGYLAGNKALSLLGKQIALGTAFKVTLISGITSLFINYVSSQIFGDSTAPRTGAYRRV